MSLLRTDGWCGIVAMAVVVFAAAAPAEDAASPVVIKATAEPKEVKIGDPIRYVVEVTSAPDTEVLIPVLSGQIGPFTITDFGEVEPEQDGERLTVARWYTLTIFETGDHFIPEPTVAYRVPGEPLAEAEGEEVLIGVVSLLAAEPEAADIRDVKPPEAIPIDWTPYLIVLGGVVLVLLLLAGFYVLVNRPRRQRVIPPLPAHEVALTELRRLEREKLVEKGEIQAFYIGLTRIIRIYLEDGFDLRAPEMTTEEFLSTAGSDQRLSSAQRRLLGEFLAQADLVKFARHHPTLRDTEAAFEAAQRFIEETRPRTGDEESDRAAA